MYNIYTSPFFSSFSCVVHGYPFYFGMLLPVSMILVGNFVVLILVTNALFSQPKNIKRQKGQTITAKIRIIFGMNILLGCTWAFGMFAVGDVRDVFQWLFTISNSLQGLFIFVFYTARNQDVRKCWGDLFPSERWSISNFFESRFSKNKEIDV